MPHLCEFLVNSSDMNLHCGSPKKIKLKCPICLNEFEKPVREIYKKGMSCSRCGSKRSFPNRICDAFLTILNIDFVPEKTFGWSNYIYDFYIPKYKMIMEIQGGQHFKKVAKFSGTTLKRRKEMDVEKEEIAIKNGIKIYDKINAENPDFEEIFDNIKKSEISKIVDVTGVSKTDVHYKAIINEDFIKVIELANLKKYYRNKISQLSNVPYDRVKEYIEFANEIGICNPLNKYREKEVIQCDVYTGKFLNEYGSVKEAETKMHSRSVGACLQGKILTALGYLWFYKKDYTKEKAIRLAEEIKNRKHGSKRPLLQYSTKNVFIKRYNSLAESYNITKISKKDIIDCAKQRTKLAGGYLWKYENERF